MLEQCHSHEDKNYFLFILTSVISLHLLFFSTIYLWETTNKPHPLPNRQKVIVQTISLKEGSTAKVSVGNPETTEFVPQATKSDPVKMDAPATPKSKKVDKLKNEPIVIPKTKEVKKVTVTKNAKTEAKPEAAKKEPENVRQQELLAKAKETIGKIGIKHDNLAKVSTANSPTYKQIGSLTAESITVDGMKGEFSSGEATYVDVLVARLRSMLKLPEYGEVAIALTLNRSGKVEKLSVLNAESRRNRDYVEAQVPTIVFPNFDKQFAKESSYTFTITLSNE